LSNTSPISNLAIIGRLELLHTRFEKVWIPGAVESELRHIRNPAALASIEEALQLGWIALRTISDRATARVTTGLLSTELHRGEGEAITLALDVSADWILLDETDGRAVASRIGLRVTGILGILLDAKQRGEIAHLKPRARFFVAARLEQEVLRSAGE